MIPVIKANGYGLGSVKIAEILENNGAQFLQLLTLDEAIELRLHNINAKLLVLGAISPKDINKAIQYDYLNCAFTVLVRTSDSLYRR